MARILLVLVAAIAVCHGKISSQSDRQTMLETNQIPRRLPEPVAPRSMDFCADCKTMVTDLKNALNDPTKMTELQNRLKALCEYTGGHAEACRIIVDNLPYAARELMPYLNEPEKVCEKLKLCNVDDTTAAMHKLLLLFVRQQFDEIAPGTLTAASNDLVCDECQFAISTIKSYFTSQEMKDKVKAYLTSLCQRLGESQTECENLMSQYLPILFQEIEAYLNDPHGVCVEAGLCKNGLDFLLVRGSPLFRPNRLSKIELLKKKALKRVTALKSMLTLLKTKAGFSVGCTVCEASFRTVVRLLESDTKALNQTVTLVENTICGLFPDEVKVQCDDFLEIYGVPSVIVALDQINPEKICTELTACKPTDVLKLRRIQGKVKEDVECEACQSFFQALEYELKNPGTVEELKGLVRRVCNMLPTQFQDECDAIAEQITTTVAALITSMDADSICKGITMCPSTTRRIN
jgi:hypothetical protein